MTPAPDDRDVAPSALRPDGTPLRVLYALDSFPQLSESYIHAEVERMRSWGVHVEVWAKNEPLDEAPSEVPVHRGTLDEAIAAVRPDVVHAHWTKSAVRYREAARRARVPMTVRGHWHFIPKQLAEIERDDTIVRLDLYPHLARKVGGRSTKLRAMTSCFHPEWLAPRVPKDRSMVARTSACKKPKDLATFIRVAKRLPHRRFVMILSSLGPNAHYRELEQLNAELGTPVELVRDLSWQDVGKRLAEAGTYLHTYDPDVSFGMPVSIAESMAAGCTVVARDVPGAREYVGDAGRVYRDEDEAVELVRATETWTDAQWDDAERRSRERASSTFDDRLVLRPLLDDWRAIAAGTLGARARRAPTPLARLRHWMGV